MKINQYLFSGTEEVASSIAVTMNLFELRCSGAVTEKLSSIDLWLPEDAIAVRSIVDNSQTVIVTTEVYYWQEQGVMGCHMRRTPIKPCDEEPIATVKRVIRLHLFKLVEKILGYKPSPWGILRGVRPTKIVHRMLDKGYAEAKVIELMGRDYAITPAKAKLVTEIACRQRTHLLTPAAAESLVSIYVGIPYCPSRCLYCSFPAFAVPHDTTQVAAFMKALAKDISAASLLVKAFDLKVQTVYIGGGTPTSLSNEDFAAMLELVRETFVGKDTTEFTVEAGRPDSITAEKIAAMVYSGVTRVSVNPQSMQQKTLNLIGRKHTVQDIINVFQNFRLAAIPAINMDIIAGLPGEDEADITDTMEQIASLKPDNLTIHTLALKRGSILTTLAEKVNLPSVEQTRNMLTIAKRYADKLAMKPYYLYRQKYMAGNMENVGYAIPGKECLYNIQIMEERQTLIGVGPAAGSKAVIPGSWRLDSCYNAKDVSSYINNLDKYLHIRHELLSSLFANRRRNH